MSSLEFTLSDVTSFLTDNLSSLKKYIYYSLTICLKNSWEDFQIIFNLIYTEC